MEKEQKQVTEKAEVIQENSLPFKSLLCRPSTIPSESGKPIYEWSYLDSDGKLQKDKTNVQEMIQSFARQCDYKGRIKKGEEFINENAIYMDTTKVGTDFDSVEQYLASIVKTLQADIQAKGSPVQVAEESSENDVQSTEIASESTTNKGEKE